MSLKNFINNRKNNQVLSAEEIEGFKFVPYVGYGQKNEKQSSRDLQAGEKRMLAKKFIEGDKVIGSPFTFTYENEGWKILCNDKTTPMKDVSMPDTLFGLPVKNANHCFEGCYNVASVSHISSYALNIGNLEYMFQNSGIREFPKQILDLIGVHDSTFYKATIDAYCVYNLEKVNDYFRQNSSESYKSSAYADWRRKNFPSKLDVLYDSEYWEEDNYYGNGSSIFIFEKTTTLKENIDVLKTNKEEKSGEFNPFQFGEKVSFIYNFEPVTIIRAIDFKENAFAIDFNTTGLIEDIKNSPSEDNVIKPFESYMRSLSTKNISDFNVNSFTKISIEELNENIKKAYDYRIGKMEKELSLETKKLEEKIQDNIKLANKAQAGLEFTPREDDLTDKNKQLKQKLVADEILL